MRIEEHVAALRREGELMARVIDMTDLDEMVPTCPGWTARALCHHVGQAHRWATTYVRGRHVERLDPAEEEQILADLPSDAGLTEWFRDGHATLVDALVTAAPSL